MKAAVLHGPRDVRFEEIAKPELQEGDVLLRVRACGICGSDLHTYSQGMLLELGNPLESGRVLGHEFSGEVVEMKGEVPGINVGDRVIAVGIGANAEYVRIPKEMTGTLLSFDESVAFSEVATTEPLACSLHAAKQGDAKDGETHVIMGAGIIGLGILQCIKSRSSAKVIVIDLSDTRLGVAERIGADRTINARNINVVEELVPGFDVAEQSLLYGLPGTVDAVYDCAGMGKDFKGTSVLEQALSIVRENGKVVVVALFERDLYIDFNVVVRKGIQVRGSWAWTMKEFIESFDLIRSGEIDRKSLVSHTFPLESASEAYETQSAAEEAVKVVFSP